MATILLSIAILLIVITLIGLVLYQIRIDGITRQRMFEIQMKMGEGQKMMMSDLPWDNLRKLLDEIIDYSVSIYILNNGLDKMNDDELAISWVTILNELCTEVELSISDEIKRQILKSITKHYMMVYIKNSVQRILIFRIKYPKKENPINDRLSTINNKSAEIQINK